MLNKKEELCKMKPRRVKVNLKRKLEGDTYPDTIKKYTMDENKPSGMDKPKDTRETNFEMDDSVLTHGPSQLVAVELNKRLPKAKENEQDPMPSDGEDGYPDLNLSEEVLKKRKLLREQRKLQQQQQQQQQQLQQQHNVSHK